MGRLFTDKEFSDTFVRSKDFLKNKSEGIEYFDTIEAIGYSYGTVYFIKNEGGKNEERYVGYLFHSGVARVVKFIRDNIKSIAVRKKLFLSSKLHLTVPVKIIEGAGAAIYQKDPLIDNQIQEDSTKYPLTYILVKSGIIFIDYTNYKFNKKDYSGARELYYKLGKLKGILNNAGLYQRDFGPINVVVIDGELKLIDFWDKNRHPREPLQLCKISDLDHANLMQYLETFHLNLRNLNLHGLEHKYYQMLFIKEMFEGYFSEAKESEPIDFRAVFLFSMSRALTEWLLEKNKHSFRSKELFCDVLELIEHNFDLYSIEWAEDSKYFIEKNYTRFPLLMIQYADKSYQSYMDVVNEVLKSHDGDVSHAYLDLLDRFEEARQIEQEEE